jgi:hypothetical protein
MKIMDHKYQHGIKLRPTADRPAPKEEPRKPSPYEQDPGSGGREDERVNEGKETVVREEEGVGMKPKDVPARDTRRTSELSEEDVVIGGEEDILPSGIQTGQTSRGSYSTDTSTGGGRYADHRAGAFGVDDVAQPGNDEDVEPDPIDPKIGR